MTRHLLAPCLLSGILSGCTPLVLTVEEDPPEPLLCESLEFVPAEPRVSGRTSACDRGKAAVVGLRSFDSLQAAIRDAKDGRTVFVCPGIHPGPIQIVGRRLAITAARPDLAPVVLKGETGRVLELADSVVSLGDVVIQGGYAVHGAGIHAVDSGVLLHDVSVRSNDAEALGGGLYAARSAVQLLGTTFQNNHSFLSGGALALSGGCLRTERAQLIDNVAEQHGGAIHYDGQPPAHVAVTLRSSRLTGNTAGGHGGAIAFGGAPERAELLVDNSLIDCNQAGTDGGAVATDGVGELRVSLRHSAFDANEAGRRGGAVATQGGGGEHVLEIDDTSFTGNRAVARGGAVYHLARGPLDRVEVRAGDWLENEAAFGTALAVAGRPSALSIDGARFSEPRREHGSLVTVFHEAGVLTVSDLAVDGGKGVLPIMAECGGIEWPVELAGTCRDGVWTFQ